MAANEQLIDKESATKLFQQGHIDEPTYRKFVPPEPGEIDPWANDMPNDQLAWDSTPLNTGRQTTTPAPSQKLSPEVSSRFDELYSEAEKTREAHQGRIDAKNLAETVQSKEQYATKIRSEADALRSKIQAGMNEARIQGLSKDAIQYRFGEDVARLQSLEKELEKTTSELAALRPQPETTAASGQVSASQQQGLSVPAPGMDLSHGFGVSPSEAPYIAAGLGQLSGTQKQIKAIEKGAVEGARIAAQEASYLNSMEQELKRREVSYNQELEAQQEAMQEAQAKYQAAVDEFSQMKVDKNRLFRNMSTGDKVIAGIAMFLGAFGQGDSNQAVKVIQDAIDRDIAEQKAAIETKAKDISNRRGILVDMMNRFQDKRQALLASRAMLLEQAKLGVQKFASQYKSAELQMKAGQLQGQLENEFNQTIAQLLKAAAERQKANSLGLKPEDLYAQTVPGYEGIVPSKSEAEKFRAKLATTTSAVRGLDRLLELSEKGSSLSLEDRTEANTLVNMLAGQIREDVLGPGTVTEAEREILLDMVRNPTNFWSIASRNKKALNVLKGNIQNSLDDQARSLRLRRIPTPQEQIGFKPQ